MNKASYYQKAQEGLLRKGEQNPDFVQELVNSGEAFTDLDQVPNFTIQLCVAFCVCSIWIRPHMVSLHWRSCPSLSIYSSCVCVLPQLFRAERQAHRAEDIALRLKANYSISSPEWQRWTNYTEKTNSTSLLQVKLLIGVLCISCFFVFSHCCDENYVASCVRYQ